MACVFEGSLVDIDTALKIEGRYFAHCVTSQVAKNMIGTLWFQLNAINKGKSRPEGLPKSTVKKLGILGAVYQSPSAQAYIPNLAQAARKGADLVVSVGFDPANAVAKVAKQFPKTHFARIDVHQKTAAGQPKNVMGLLFHTQGGG